MLENNSIEESVHYSYLLSYGGCVRYILGQRNVNKINSYYGILKIRNREDFSAIDTGIDTGRTRPYIIRSTPIWWTTCRHIFL